MTVFKKSNTTVHFNMNEICYEVYFDPQSLLYYCMCCRGVFTRERGSQNPLLVTPSGLTFHPPLRVNLSHPLVLKSSVGHQQVRLRNGPTEMRLPSRQQSTIHTFHRPKSQRTPFCPPSEEHPCEGLSSPPCSSFWGGPSFPFMSMRGLETARFCR